MGWNLSITLSNYVWRLQTLWDYCGSYGFSSQKKNGHAHQFAAHFRDFQDPPPQELIYELELENPWFHFPSNSFDSNEIFP